LWKSGLTGSNFIYGIGVAIVLNKQLCSGFTHVITVLEKQKICHVLKAVSAYGHHELRNGHDQSICIYAINVSGYTKICLKRAPCSLPIMRVLYVTHLFNQFDLEMFTKI